MFPAIIEALLIIPMKAVITKGGLHYHVSTTLMTLERTVVPFPTILLFTNDYLGLDTVFFNILTDL